MLRVSRIFKIIRTIAWVISSKKYRKSGETLTELQLKAISVGAINSEQTMFYCDSLKTGDSVSILKEDLSNYYGLSASSVKEVLDWALLEGHRMYFDIIKADTGVALNPKERRNKVIALLSKDDKEKLNVDRALAFLDNLDKCIYVLIKNKFINHYSDLSNISVLAWDLGRLVNITRSSYDCGYITEQEAWDYIYKAYDQIKKTYENWDEVAKGYIIGRAMWGGPDSSLNVLIDITQDLLKDKDSPWMLHQLK